MPFTRSLRELCGNLCEAWVLPCGVRFEQLEGGVALAEGHGDLGSVVNAVGFHEEVVVGHGVVAEGRGLYWGAVVGSDYFVHD